MKKVCTKCKRQKSITDFGKNCAAKDEHRSDCKECNKKFHARRKSDPNYMKNRSNNTNKWKRDNPQRVKEIRPKSDKNCRPHIRKYMQHKRNTDVQFRLATRLRIRMWHAIMRSNKGTYKKPDTPCSSCTPCPPPEPDGGSSS